MENILQGMPLLARVDSPCGEIRVQLEERGSLTMDCDEVRKLIDAEVLENIPRYRFVVGKIFSARLFCG